LVAPSKHAALVSSEISNSFIFTTPTADAAQIQGDSKVGETSIMVSTLITTKSLSHIFAFNKYNYIFFVNQLNISMKP